MKKILELWSEYRKGFVNKSNSQYTNGLHTNEIFLDMILGWLIYGLGLYFENLIEKGRDCNGKEKGKERS